MTSTGKKMSRSERAKLAVSVSNVSGLLKAKFRINRMSDLARLYTAAAVDQVFIDVVENAIKRTLADKRKIIQPRDIELSNKEDEEINELFSSDHIVGTGVHPDTFHSIPSKGRGRKRTRKIVLSLDQTRERAAVISILESIRAESEKKSAIDAAPAAKVAKALLKKASSVSKTAASVRKQANDIRAKIAATNKSTKALKEKVVLLKKKTKDIKAKTAAIKKSTKSSKA